MSWTHGNIDGGTTLSHTDTGDIHITGKIDGGSIVTLISTNGAIIIDGKVDGGSTANLTAANVIQIGAAGSDAGDKKIYGGSTVSAQAGDDISVGGKIDGSSNVTLVSDGGSITIGGKIDNSSVVSLTADGNISIGEAGNDGAERKIDGNSRVDARAGGTIHLYNKIDGGSVSGKHTKVDFKACRGINIDDKIDGGSIVRLATNTGTINIGDKIGGGGTNVTFWPAGSLQVQNGIDSNGSATAANWVSSFDWCGQGGPPGYYWRNWPQTFGYVTPNRRYPRSLADIASAIQEATSKGLPIKAVGGGWSFSDASLPMKTQAEVDAISILKRGANGTEDFSHVLQGLNGVTNSPADLQPENVIGDLASSSHYDQPSLEQVTDSGPNLILANSTYVMDTRGLASSLQEQLHSILSDTARAAKAHYFHVEAGITMADLDQLLDHQNPRLALQASGGSVGATLAGTLSTATHGAEFQWPLLVDRVRAIHLVSPTGKEWWIEGEVPIADLQRLRKIYPNVVEDRFIAKKKQFGGLSAQDVLNAVIVSMGTMGVFYSVVLEVVPQFGLQQICVALPLSGDTTGWAALLQRAGTSEDKLRSGSVAANTTVFEFLLDGLKNGTGIAFNMANTENVFCDLAINPFNLDCWITNRRVTKDIPVDGNSPAPDWQPALTETLGSRAVDSVGNSRLLGRIFDFLNWATDLESNPFDAKVDAEQAIRLATFITSYPDSMVSAAATLNVQAVANAANEPDHPDRGQQFLGDALSGFLHAVQGTTNGQTGDTTDVSYKISGFGWPTNGVPGRGLEIALPQETAFTFLQKVIFDDVLTNTMRNGNKPLIGYISVRVCPPTKTLLGMQQFSPFSIMIEVVGYRSPEANAVMDIIQTKALDRTQERLGAMLHWGLENDQMTGADLLRMPVSRLLSGTDTRLSAFKKVRQLLMEGQSSPFENNFVSRLNL
jgi:FAD binding domain